MRRKLLLTSIGGVVALAPLAAGAVAAPGHFGAQSSASLVTLAHHGGGAMGMHFSGPRGPSMQLRSVPSLRPGGNLPRSKLPS